MLNKTKQPIEVRYDVLGLEGATLHGMSDKIIVEPGKVVPVTALVRVPDDKLSKGLMPIEFKAEVINNSAISTSYESMFMAPE
jgi:hypothetical protein